MESSNRCTFCSKDPCICGDCTEEKAPAYVVSIILVGEYEQALGLYRKFKHVMDDKAVAKALGECDHTADEDDFHDLVEAITYVPVGESMDECEHCQKNKDVESSVIHYLKSGKSELAYSLQTLHFGQRFIGGTRVRAALTETHDPNDSYWHKFVGAIRVDWEDILHSKDCEKCKDLHEMKLDERNESDIDCDSD